MAGKGKEKSLRPVQGRRPGLRGTTLVAARRGATTWGRDNGRTRCRLASRFTGKQTSRGQKGEAAGEFGLRRSAGAPCQASTLPGSLCRWPTTPAEKPQITQIGTEKTPRAPRSAKNAKKILCPLKVSVPSVFSLSIGANLCKSVDENYRLCFCYEHNTRHGDRVLGGGPRGTRTLDLLNAIETRSQLRHGPTSTRGILPCLRCFVHQVDLAGFEPATSSVRLKRAPNCATGPSPSEGNCNREARGCQEKTLKRLRHPV